MTTEPFNPRSIVNQIRYVPVILIVASLLITSRILIDIAFLNNIAYFEQFEQGIANSLADEIDTALNNIVSNIQLTASTTDLMQLSFPFQETILQRLRDQNPAYVWIATLNRQGGVDAERPQLSVRGQRFVIGETVTISPVTNEGERQMITIIIPLQGGAVAAGLDLRFIQESIASGSFGAPGHAYLVDEDYHLIASSNPEFPIFTDFSQRQSIVNPDADETYVNASALANNERWRVVVEIPTADALATVRAMLSVMGIALITTVGVVIWLSVVLSRRIAAPLQQLTETATAIEAGHLDRRVDYQSDNELGILAKAFNGMTGQLQQTLANLETRIEERTRELRLASNIAKQITTLLSLDNLLPQVVETTRDVFDLYGVFVLLVDAKGEILHFAAGTGKAGEYLLLQHSQVRLDSERSLVAKAARTRQIVVVNDVSLEPLYVAMPEMPETRSEIVIPLVVGDRLLGVLDIEHHETNRFKEDDVRAFSSLADQIAIAVQNAHLYADQVKVAEELRETDRMKSQFLASMSHELRTPLNAILNFSKFLKMGVYGEINTEQTEALNNVLISSEHLLDLINDVLDVAKIEAGMLQLFVEDKISLEPDVNSVIATAKTLVRDKPITLIEEIDPDLPLVVGDRRRIKQILLNLVSNACKFTRKGSITIRVKREGENVCFAVIDTGPGISETDQASIFEPFEQSKDGLKQGGGTGLGLAIASKLAEAHGGNLSLESEVGVGSSFYFTLPVCAPQLLEQM